MVELNKGNAEILYFVPSFLYNKIMPVLFIKFLEIAT